MRLSAILLTFYLKTWLLTYPSGGILPGIVLYYSGFYKRDQIQLRFAFLFSVTSLAGAFSGLLAAAIQHMDGMRGIAGWKWIFILASPDLICGQLRGIDISTQEGVFTVFVGLFGFYWIPPTPEDMWFLTELQKRCYTDSLVEDWSGAADVENEEFRWSEVLSIFTDAPHILILWVIFFCNGFAVRITLLRA